MSEWNRSGKAWDAWTLSESATDQPAGSKIGRQAFLSLQCVSSDRMAHSDDPPRISPLLVVHTFLPVLQVFRDLGWVDLVGAGWKAISKQDDHVPGLGVADEAGFVDQLIEC